MFGFSFAELIVVLILAFVFIKPQDLPEIAHFLGKVIFRVRKFFSDSKSYLKSVEGEIGLDQLKQELNRGIAEEKAKIEDDMTVIVDMYGNEHQVPNVKTLRSDLSEEEIAAEILRSNEDNIKKSNSDQKQDRSL